MSETEMISFRLSRMHVPQCYVQAPNDEVSELDIRFPIKMQLAVLEEREEIEIACTIKMEHSHTNQIYLAVDLVVGFHIRDFDDHRDETAFQMRPEFATTLASICYSTMRGIIFERAAGTRLQSWLLPIVDPASLVRGIIPQSEEEEGD